MTPMELKSKSEWNGILKQFALDTNITTCLTDSKGSPLSCYYYRYPLCSAIRENSEATTFICSQINTAMLGVVQKSLRPEVDMCDVGLLRVVVPIVRDRTVVGLITACGLASEDEELNSFLVAKQLGVTEKRVQELAKLTPFGSEENLEQIGAQLFETLNRDQP